LSLDVEVAKKKELPYCFLLTKLKNKWQTLEKPTWI
jgi:hypothetical protein